MPPRRRTNAEGPDGRPEGTVGKDARRGWGSGGGEGRGCRGRWRRAWWAGRRWGCRWCRGWPWQRRVNKKGAGGRRAHHPPPRSLRTRTGKLKMTGKSGWLRSGCAHSIKTRRARLSRRARGDAACVRGRGKPHLLGPRPRGGREKAANRHCARKWRGEDRAEVLREEGITDTGLAILSVAITVSRTCCVLTRTPRCGPHPHAPPDCRRRKAIIGSGGV